MIDKAVIAIFLLFAIGCGVQSSPKTQPQQGVDGPVEVDVVLANRIQTAVSNHASVDQSIAAVVKDDVSVAVKVSGFDRLRLKAIRQELHSQVKELVPKDYVVHITTDKRLFADLQKAITQLKQEDNIASEDIQNQIKQIKKNMQG